MLRDEMGRPYWNREYQELLIHKPNSQDGKVRDSKRERFQILRITHESHEDFHDTFAKGKLPFFHFQDQVPSQLQVA